MTITEQTIVSNEHIVAQLQALISSRILVSREQRVLLDAKLAELYGVQTKVLIQTVKRSLPFSSICETLKVQTNKVKVMLIVALKSACC